MIIPTGTHVGVAGDWHGDTGWALRMLDLFAAHSIQTVLHVGDFGLWPGSSGAKYLRKLNRKLVSNDQVIYVTPGNHEWYEKLGRTPVGDDGLQQVAERILFMPRGFRWQWGDHSFLSLGGAPSIDFERRTPALSWWPEEALTAGDLYRLQDDVQRNGAADVMITHDAPKGLLAIEKNIAGNEKWFSERELRYAAEGREMLHAAWEMVSPGKLFHGHYHCVVDEELENKETGAVTHVVGLHRDGFEGNIAALDLDTLEVKWLAVPDALAVTALAAI